MEWVHSALAVSHALASAAWFGSMFYSLTVMQPRAKRYFDTLQEFEEFVATVAQGARWKVLSAFAFVAVTGAGLIILARPASPSRVWIALMTVKCVLFLAALAIFCYASWRLWPRRIFATPEELPSIQRAFHTVGWTLLSIAGTSMVLGILPHTW